MLRAVCLAALILLSGCSQAMKGQDGYVTHYYRGDGEGAMRVADQLRVKKCDEVWLLLDRATLALSQGDSEKAINDYKRAIEAIDYWNQVDVKEQLAKIALQDQLGGYGGFVYEQQLAPLYFAFALIEKGDLSNARAVLRACVEYVPEEKRNPLALYLFSILLAHEGDTSNSAIVLEQARQLQPTLPKWTQAPNFLVVVHEGKSPRKVSAISGASIASTVVLDALLGSHPHLSSFSGIPVPLFIDEPSYPLRLSLCANGQPLSLSMGYDVEQAAHLELEEQMPAIVARGVARMVLRREMVHQVERRNETWGAIADLGCLVANLATTADTRSWKMLPRALLIAIGGHCPSLELNLEGERLSFPIPQKEFTIIHLFHPHPGNRAIIGEQS